MSNDPDRPTERRVSGDEETIREWAERHDAVPVRSGRADESGRLGVMPEDTLSESHERMEWEAFFTELEGGERVVVYHGETAGEPFEVASRQEAIADVDESEAEERLLQGETVTTEVTETSVVESVVIEEVTVESELVDTDVLEQRVVDVELLSREPVDCRLVPEGDVDPATLFDADAYVAQLDQMDVEAGTPAGAEPTGGAEQPVAEERPPAADEPPAEERARGVDQPPGEAPTADEPPGEAPTADEAPPTGAEPTAGEEQATAAERPTGRDRPGDEAWGRGDVLEVGESFPYHVEVDVEETWSVVRELVEEFRIESRVTDAEVTEADSIEDHAVDVQGLHQSIFEEGIVESDAPPEEALGQYDVESDLADADRIRTTVTRERTVEDEVVDEVRLRADVTEGERRGMRRVHTTLLETDFGEGTSAGAQATEAGAEGVQSSDVGAAATDVDESLEGMSVVNADGEDVGMVSAVEPDRNVLYVDVEPGITERIMAALGWGDADEEDSPLPAEAIDHVTDDEIVLKRSDDLSDAGGEDRV